jgi:hypothetical protein
MAGYTYFTELINHETNQSRRDIFMTYEIRNIIYSLCCQLEGRGFETPWDNSIFFQFTYALQPQYAGSWARPVREADNLNTVCEPII